MLKEKVRNRKKWECPQITQIAQILDRLNLRNLMANSACTRLPCQSRSSIYGPWKMRHAIAFNHLFLPLNLLNLCNLWMILCLFPIGVCRRASAAKTSFLEVGQ